MLLVRLLPGFVLASELLKSYVDFVRLYAHYVLAHLGVLLEVVVLEF